MFRPCKSQLGSMWIEVNRRPIARIRPGGPPAEALSSRAGEGSNPGPPPLANWRRRLAEVPTINGSGPRERFGFNGRGCGGGGYGAAVVTTAGVGGPTAGRRLSGLRGVRRG